MVDLGSKYECTECGTKFYDLGRSDTVCPKCECDPKAKENPTVPAKATKAKKPKRAAATSS